MANVNTPETRKPLGASLRTFLRRKRKTLLSVGLILLLALAVLGGVFIYYSIANSFSTDGLVFEELDDGTLAVTGYKGSDTTVTVAKKHDGKRVTVIAKGAFLENSEITAVRLRGIEKIEANAFMGCSALTDIFLPDGLVSIGTGAFASCGELASVSIPDSVTSLGKNCFVNCLKLLSAKIGKGVTDIPDTCFANCRALTTLSLPSTLKTIGNRSFEKCRSLPKVVIPNGVTSIGEYAFSGDTGYKMHMESLSLPNSLTSIGTGAFGYCDRLEKVTLPSGLTEVSDFLFNECSALTQVILPDGLISIGTSAFFGNSCLEYLTIPASVERIGGLAFYGNPWLNSTLADDDGFIIINEILLGYFGSKTELVLPSEGYHTVSFLLRGNLSVTSVEIPAGSCRRIERQAIANCGALKTVKIGEGVEVLGDSLFYYDAALTDVYLPSTLTDIENNLFDECAAMANLYYAGTRSQWKEITIGETNDDLKNLKVICAGNE